MGTVEEYRRRRAKRIEQNKKARMDAGIGWVYGILKENGVNVKGMSAPEAFEELSKLRGKSGSTGRVTGHEKKPRGVKEEVAKNSVGSKYLNEFHTNNGVSYPKLSGGRVWDIDTLKEVNRLAREGNKDREYEKTIKNIKPEQIVTQKDPDGTKVSSIPGLSRMYDSEVVGKSPEVQAEYDRRVEMGKEIASDMVRISDELGSRMMGLENCFKGGASTSRKIDKVKDKAKKAGKSLSDADALRQVDDVVRFSYKCDNNRMAEQVRGLEKALEKNGYEIVERDNKFLPNRDGSPRDYKAVHLQVKSPKGEKFEVQVQSEDTIRAKNKNHRLYEEYRTLDENTPRAKELKSIMVKNASEIPEPSGIKSLESYNRTKFGKYRDYVRHGRPSRK